MGNMIAGRCFLYPILLVSSAFARYFSSVCIYHKGPEVATELVVNLPLY